MVLVTSFIFELHLVFELCLIIRLQSMIYLHGKISMDRSMMGVLSFPIQDGMSIEVTVKGIWEMKIMIQQNTTGQVY